MAKNDRKPDAPTAPRRWQDHLAPLSDNLSWPATWGLIFLAWLVGAAARYRWLHFANGVDAFKWNGVPLTNTNDTYLFASIIQKAHLGTLQEIPDCPGVMAHGMITVLPWLLLKVLPAGVTLDHLMAWLPVFLGGLIAVPVVLIGRLYGSTVWGFCAALIAGVSNSYLNRTIAGYYDTDLFSVTLPALALYFLLAAHKNESLRMIIAGALTLFVYPFFYSPGSVIAFALGIAYVGIRVLFHFGTPFTWRSILIIELALAFLESSVGSTLAERPFVWFGQFGILIAACFAAPRLFLPTQWADRQKRVSLIALIVLVTGYTLAVAGPVQKIYGRAASYARAAAGKLAVPAETSAIKFHNVLSTVQESVTAPGAFMEKARTMAERTSGSARTTVIALVGYALLVLWRREFLIASPLLGLGIFAIWGGFRFTIHATAIVALAAVYLVLVAAQFFSPWRAVAWGCAGAVAIEALVPIVRNYFPIHAKTIVVLAVVCLVFVATRLFPSRRAAVWGCAGVVAIAALVPIVPIVVPIVVRNFTIHPTVIAGLNPIAIVALTAIVVLAVVCLVFVAALFFPSLQAALRGCVGAATIAALAPNVEHLLQYNPPPVLENQAVEVLDIAKRAVKPGDYLLTWWDYGTAGWYYSGLRTVCDPGNQGDDIFLVAKALNSPSQRLAANLTRLGIETHAQTNLTNSAIRTLLTPRLNEFGGLDGFFRELENPAFKPPAKTREIYVFLPTMLLYMIPPMRHFSERDLLKGEKKPDKTLQIYDRAEINDREVRLFAGNRPAIVVDRKTLVATVLSDGRRFTLHTLDFIQRSQQRNLAVSRQPGDPNSNLHLTLSLDPPLTILMDREIFQSNLMQMFLYEIFDPTLFEPVAFNSKAKLYRLKR